MRQHSVNYSAKQRFDLPLAGLHNPAARVPLRLLLAMSPEMIDVAQCPVLGDHQSFIKKSESVLCIIVCSIAFKYPKLGGSVLVH